MPVEHCIAVGNIVSVVANWGGGGTSFLKGGPESVFQLQSNDTFQEDLCL